MFVRWTQRGAAACRLYSGHCGPNKPPLRWTVCQSVVSVVISSFVLNGLAVSAQAQTGPPARKQVGRERLQAADMRVAKQDPRLEQVLQDWSKASGAIKKLQGTHKRWTYNNTFNVVKIASGKFYYESPDKGRIDIEPAEIPEGMNKLPRRNRGTYDIKRDSPQRWICTGTEVHQIDDDKKERKIIPIPPEQRGANIMDGPLPFLFGMPPAEAKRRYQLRLLRETEADIILQIHPRRQQDLANWRSARVILAKSNYLPRAVELIDPSGGEETVFEFHHNNLKINKRGSIFGLNPFNPILLGYKNILERVPEPRPMQGNSQPGVRRLPSVIGLHFQDAQDLLKRAGYQCNFQQGSTATVAEQVYHVEAQNPRPGAVVGKGTKVVLTLYLDKQKAQKVQSGGPGAARYRRTAKQPSRQNVRQQ